MPRIRTIKPEFWTDDKVIEISITARLFFIGLWSFADDNGVVENKPRQLKARIFPADNIEVEFLIQELARQKLIVMYHAAGQSYLMVTNFRKHQVIDKPRKTCLPTPDQATKIFEVKDFQGNQLISTEISPGKGREEEKEEEGKESMRAEPSPTMAKPLLPELEAIEKALPADAGLPAKPPDGGNGVRTRLNFRLQDFEKFYQAYPKKTARKTAEDSWRSKVKQGRLPPLDTLLLALEAHKKSRQWLEGVIPHPATWVSQERWNDQMETEIDPWKNLH